MKNSYLWILLIIFIGTGCSCKKNNEDQGDQDQPVKNITILYTNDEHGWMASNDDADGAPGIMKMWKSLEGYDGSDAFLVLSGGDMWSGPALSTWFEGKSMVEVMNAMEYDAAVIGNHEFDFTVEILEERLQEMDFPLLAANITTKSGNQIPGFALPYMIEDCNGVKVGIVGLASTTTPWTTFPANVEDYNFTDYEDALIKYVPEAKNDGAEVIIVAGHICESEMEALIPVAKAQGVTIITGGHCHEKVAKMQDGVLLIEAGSYMRNYAKVELSYDKNSGNTSIISYTLVENNKGSLDNDVENIVSYWQQEEQNALGEVIGYCSATIERGSAGMANMITDSWLVSYPDAHVSLTNAGGIRQDIPAGDITLGTIVGVLPFENSIIKLELTGEQLIECIDYLLPGGMTTIEGYNFLDGTPVDYSTTYTVLITDYLYSLSNSDFSKYDPDPEFTSSNYRDPTIDWIKSLNTTTQDPLNNYLDNTPRR